MFKNRLSAGIILAQKLVRYKGDKSVVVVAIPRGGVVTAKPISNTLNLPLEALVTKKIPAPHQPELAIGAVGPGGRYILDQSLIESLRLTKEEINRAVRIAEEKRQDYSRKFSKDLHMEGKVVIIVDDGAATGSTVELAIDYARLRGARKVVVALPIAPQEVALKLDQLADDSYILDTPKNFQAVGQFYEDFPQVSDSEVLQYLKT